ncbi:branched-chain amino acid ABC transporter permease [Hoeflea alexandrii]|uniref:branched-chain amino acid ABC transporter permease n=1 Tax=Hoeflea alexandrii TaxID=288436 RepID=UPI0022AE7E6A|nr:branched-chain amino acid ABC transporter permease [Hoeflea alexandrii]MCZ4292240.1 branched-chain amino acid ABC transporter permease [Hoeflea alexandrii]
MDSTITLFLLQDGLINGSIYALLAVAFVLLFAVTRIIFVAQGDFVAYGGLTFAALQQGSVPGSIWLLAGLGIIAGTLEFLRERRALTRPKVLGILAGDFVFPLTLTGVAILAAPQDMPYLFDMALALTLVVPMGPYIYRICFRPMASASVLVLLIASVGVHWLMIGLGLLFFGAEGYRAAPMFGANFALGPVPVSAQSLLVMGATLALLVGFYLFFGRTLAGKALMATAVNARGASLVGISPSFSGRTAFLMAAFVGAISGILIAPLTTLYYDSGFLIGLKGFVAAIVAGFASFPLAVAGAIAIGIAEAVSAFFASAFKEVIVFSLILPILIWRSIRAPHLEED